MAAADHHERQHDRVVTRDHALDAEEAKARPAEDRLGDGGAGEQRRDRQAQQRDDRDQGVAQAVLEDHPVLRQALGLAVRM